MYNYQTILKQRNIESSLIVRIQEMFDITLGEALMNYFERPYLQNDIESFSDDADEEECVEYLMQRF